MRITAVSAAVALTLVCVSTSLYGQKPDDQIDPRSIAWVKKGDAARAAGNLQRAVDSYETALAVDPRNRQAFIAMAGVADSQGLTGKAIRLYREALRLDPTDLTALQQQGEAMIAKGAVKSASENLEKMRKICGQDCAQANRLASAIARVPAETEEKTQSARQDAAPKPGAGKADAN